LHGLRVGWRLSRRQWAIVLVSLPLFAAIHGASYWLRFEGQLGPTELSLLTSTLLPAVVLKAIVFTWFRVYNGWSRYVTFHDLLLLVQAATVSSVLLALGDYLLLPQVTVPRSVFLMDWGTTIVAIGGLRSLARMLDEGRSADILHTMSKPVLIVGANNSGEALLRAIRRTPKLHYRVIGFISEKKDSVDTCIGGIPVLGTLNQTCSLAQQFRVSDVLITAGELAGNNVRQLVEDGRKHNVNVKVLPSYEQLLAGNVDLRPRQVSIEDLLCRDPVQLDMRELHQWLDDRVLVVTGSAGSIGSEICRQLLQFSPRRLVAIDRSENGQFFLERELRRLNNSIDIDICIADLHDSERLDCVFAKNRPDIVFHAAAYKHVPLMESNSGEAVKNIILTTRKLADLSETHHVSSFVMISSDKAVNPTNVMGACKRVAELYIQGMAHFSKCRFVTVRFGNVLDSAGSVVPIFRSQIAAGGPVTVTDPEMRRYFMTIPEASQLVIQAGAMGHGGEIFVLDMGNPVRIVDLARDMIRLSGLRVDEDIQIQFTGVRSGEKLFEELHCEGERHLATSHPKILIAESGQTDVDALRHGILRLQQAADGPKPLILREINNLVPSFTHSEMVPVPERRAA
jgi:FlaA1/EpsC-like NDP-sugar epimerase